MSTGKVVLATLIGVAIGATVGVLIAPDKGSETRKRLSTGGGDYLKQLKDKYNAAIDNITEKLDEIQETSEQTENQL